MFWFETEANSILDLLRKKQLQKNKTIKNQKSFKCVKNSKEYGK